MTKHHHCKKTPTVFTFLTCTLYTFPTVQSLFSEFYMLFLWLLDPGLQLGVGVLQNRCWLALLESDAPAGSFGFGSNLRDFTRTSPLGSASLTLTVILAFTSFLASVSSRDCDSVSH